MLRLLISALLASCACDPPEAPAAAAGPPKPKRQMSSEPLGAATLSRVVKSRMKRIRQCYESELKRDPGLAGTIEIEITVHEGRAASSVIVLDTVGSKNVNACIQRKIRRIRFPPSSAPTTFVLPLLFASGG